MILSDKTIKEMLSKKEGLSIDPIDPSQIQCASVDLHIGNSFKVIQHNHKFNESECIKLDEPIRYLTSITYTFYLEPRSFVLATTEETISLPNDIAAFVEGRSSIGRVGLFIQNAGWIDPGFKGKITLELFNATDKTILVQAYRRVCQLVFCKMDQPVENPYDGKYQGQMDTKGSKIDLDDEIQN